jgi:NAD(P)-dependent dehydrogenase (short-subunit alcohol dehydrogenase family)
VRTLVIGGNSGIGAQVAEDLRARGDIVKTPLLEEFDVRSRIGARIYLEDELPFNRIVYSAGVNELMPLGKINSDDLLLTYEVNVLGFILLLDAVARLSHSYTSSIVAIVSDSATVAMRHSIAYASSKAALAHAIRCAARELAPWCRVNGVSPSMVNDTPMTEHVDERVRKLRNWTWEQAHAYEMSLVPMGRRCTKLEVSRLVLDVLDGPEFMTGAIIPISGGK